MGAPRQGSQPRTMRLDTAVPQTTSEMTTVA